MRRARHVISGCQKHDTDHRQPYRFWAYPQVRACVAAAVELVRVGVERAVLPFQRGLFADPQPLRLRWGSPLLPPRRGGGSALPSSSLAIPVREHGSKTRPIPLCLNAIRSLLALASAHFPVLRRRLPCDNRASNSSVFAQFRCESR